MYQNHFSDLDIFFGDDFRSNFAFRIILYFYTKRILKAK